MTIITNEYGQRVLTPAYGKCLLAVEEQELPIEERNYTQAVYIANVLTLEDCERMYVEAEYANNREEIEQPKEDVNG